MWMYSDINVRIIYCSINMSCCFCADAVHMLRVILLSSCRNLLSCIFYWKPADFFFYLSSLPRTCCECCSCSFLVVLSYFCRSPRVDEDEEIIVKAMTDYWVVGKKSDQRELYVILNQKNANLIEVNGMSPPPEVNLCHCYQD